MIISKKSISDREKMSPFECGFDPKSSSRMSISDREKMSPFECGFDPKSSSRMPFSMRFFMITIMFLIFDVEITLILPMIPTFLMSNIINWSFTSLTFIIILLIGLYHEWNQGMLNWSK
nr:NADH dehydrogenase subunit 3 [Raymondia sp. A GC-2023a]